MVQCSETNRALQLIFHGDPLPTKEHSLALADDEAISSPPCYPPSGEPTTRSVGYVPNKGQNQGYGCIGISTYKEAGVHEQDIAMTKFW